MNIDLHILSEYRASFEDGIEPDSPIESFASGYKAGLRDGQTIKQSIVDALRAQAEQEGFNRGNAQGLAYAAYAASHTSTIDIHAAMKPAEAAAQMRDNIAATLEVARNLAMQRTTQ